MRERELMSKPIEIKLKNAWLNLGRKGTHFHIIMCWLMQVFFFFLMTTNLFCRYVLDSETAGPLTLFMLEVLFLCMLVVNVRLWIVFMILLKSDCRRCLILQDWCQNLGLLI